MRGRHRRAFRLALASGATALVFAVGGMVAVTLAAGPEDEGDTTTTVEQPAPPPTTSTDADPPVVKISGVMPAYESGANGVTVVFGVSAVDGVDGPVPPTCEPESGATFSLGGHSITCRATDSSGNTGVDTATFTVQDTTPPSVTISGVQPAYESGPDGATVTFSVSAVDSVAGPLEPQCDATTGDAFVLGGHSIRCKAADTAGNTGMDSVTFTVQDTTNPVVTISGVQQIYESGPNGASVTFTVSAVDNLDGQLDPDCNPSSPRTFGPGNHSIICSATDKSGNKGTDTKDFTVRDPKAPTVTISGVQPTYESGAKGASVKFTASAVESTGEPVVDISCNPPSGTTFALGPHAIVCTATDSRQNAGTDTAAFKVQDTIPPVLPNLPASVTIYANTPSGATDAQATLNDLADTKANDVVDPNPRVTFDPAIGFLPIGVTVITVTATDFSGNSSHRKTTFEVRGMPAAGSPEEKQAQSPPRLDTTPPPNPDGLKSKVGERFVTLSWNEVPGAKDYVATRSGGTQRAMVRDTVVYEGPATTFTDRSVKKGVQYRYVVAAVDAAGNRSAGVVLTVTPRAIYLVRPADGFRVTGGTVDFRWAPVRGAGYYNLQLYRRVGRGVQGAGHPTKILSIWPPRARYRLALSWRYQARRYALSPGSYVWYIWPGFGPRAKATYGNLLGQSSFVVTKRKK